MHMDECGEIVNIKSFLIVAKEAILKLDISIMGDCCPLSPLHNEFFFYLLRLGIIPGQTPPCPIWVM
jgi:hypothetical protein